MANTNPQITYINSNSANLNQSIQNLRLTQSVVGSASFYPGFFNKTPSQILEELQALGINYSTIKEFYINAMMDHINESLDTITQIQELTNIYPTNNLVERIKVYNNLVNEESE